LRLPIPRHVTKLINRPPGRFNRQSRLFTIFSSCLGLALSYCPRLVVSILLLLPVSNRVRLGVANTIFQLDYPEQALDYLQRSSHSKNASSDENLLRAMCFYHGMGRFRDAMALLAQANERNFKEAERLGLADKPYRVLENLWARLIGHTALIDYVIKLGILEGRRPEETILYLPARSHIGNRFLLNQIAPNLRVVERSEDLPFPASAVQILHYDFLGPRLPDQTTAYFWTVAGETYQRWEREGRAPLLKFPPDVAARGWEGLYRLGLPSGAWFVALHVREGKWDRSKPGNHGIRNADPLSYWLAISEVTRQGGWVIRIGDIGMTPLPPMQNVIDYCHSSARADWMDIFILAHCRFLVGTNSGPAFVPALYGKPSVLTNWWPAGERPWHSLDLFIPKLLRKNAHDRYLSLSETLQEPFCWCFSRRYLADHGGVQLEDNDPEVIRAAVHEMLQRCDGRVPQDGALAELRVRADQIYESCGIAGRAQLAGELLRQYPGLAS
jgi:putative glycosyltransferase (TIGR04372 family)